MELVKSPNAWLEKQVKPFDFDEQIGRAHV